MCIRVDRLISKPKRREAMINELEYLLRTHGELEALSHQSTLQDMLTNLRRLADDLGLDFGSALTGAQSKDDLFLALGEFDPCI
jgi:hypothetical protein